MGRLWSGAEQRCNKLAGRESVFCPKPGHLFENCTTSISKKGYEVSDYIEHSWKIPKLFITQVHQKPLGTPMIGGQKVWNLLVPIWIISVYEYKRLASEVYVNFRIGLNFCGQFNFFFLIRYFSTPTIVGHFSPNQQYKWMR